MNGYFYVLICVTVVGVTWQSRPIHVKWMSLSSRLLHTSTLSHSYNLATRTEDLNFWYANGVTYICVLLEKFDSSVGFVSNGIYYHLRNVTNLLAKTSNKFMHFHISQIECWWAKILLWFVVTYVFTYLTFNRMQFISMPHNKIVIADITVWHQQLYWNKIVDYSLKFPTHLCCAKHSESTISSLLTE